MQCHALLKELIQQRRGHLKKKKKKELEVLFFMLYYVVFLPICGIQLNSPKMTD